MAGVHGLPTTGAAPAAPPTLPPPATGMAMQPPAPYPSQQMQQQHMQQAQQLQLQQQHLQATMRAYQQPHQVHQLVPTALPAAIHPGEPQLQYQVQHMQQMPQVQQVQPVQHVYPAEAQLSQVGAPMVRPPPPRFRQSTPDSGRP